MLPLTGSGVCSLSLPQPLRLLDLPYIFPCLSARLDLVAFLQPAIADSAPAANSLMSEAPQRRRAPQQPRIPIRYELKLPRLLHLPGAGLLQEFLLEYATFFGPQEVAKEGSTAFTSTNGSLSSRQTRRYRVLRKMKRRPTSSPLKDLLCITALCAKIVTI